MPTPNEFYLLRTDALTQGSICDIRLSTVNRVARLKLADDAGLARVHNLSNGGVELTSALDLRVGQSIQLDFSETISSAATIKAKRGTRYTLEFEHEINSAELLRRLVAEARSSRARPMRLATRIGALARSASGVQHVELDDISQRGMKVRNDGSFHPGLRVSIQLPNGRECQGMVRWSKNSSAGVQLVDILSADDLGTVSRLGDMPERVGPTSAAPYLQPALEEPRSE